MSQSLSKIYLHIIFHIKTTSPQIRKENLEHVHAYIGQLVNDAGCVNIWVDGVEDHIHILCLLGRDVTIAHLVEEVKRNCSRWIKNHKSGISNICVAGRICGILGEPVSGG